MKNEGITILLSEQNSHFALNVSERAYILEKGHVAWKGDISELRKNPQIMKNLLGV